MARILFMFILFAFRSVQASAAEISVSANNVPTPEIGKIIEVIGEITEGDDLRLIAALYNAPANTLIVLTSPGGLIAPAMSMGRVIRKTGANTLATGVCASACGLVWLAGTKRFTFSDSQIGFHAAYSGENSSVNGTGNALIGAYVAELGFGDNVIRYVTEKPPEGMQWLNDREANLLGLEVSNIANGALTKKDTNGDQSQSKNESTSSAENQDKAAILVFEIVNKHLEDTASALSYVSRNYGDSVKYYGKMIPLSAVLLDKRDYMERWPIRQTTVRSGSVTSKCDFETCLVSGIYDWAVSNPVNKKKAFGTATFSYGFLINPTMQVIFEDGKVVSRN